MAKTKKRKYTMKKRMDKAYANYKKRYQAKEASLKKRGYDMQSPMLSPEGYEAVREAYQRDGVKINLNQTIVSDQAFEYSQKQARGIRKAAEDQNNPIKDYSLTDIRTGKVDISSITTDMNEDLKKLFPTWTGVERSKYISHEVFGSD